MAETITYKCDICGVQKQDSNHWFRAEHRPDRDMFVLAKWDSEDRVIGEFKTLHLCGLQCAVKAMLKAMAE